MHIHREGRPTLILVGIILASVNLLILSLTQENSLLWFTLPASFAVWGFFAWFFRNPARSIPQTENQVIAPADGKIVALEQVTENEYFRDERLKISIYMSALNVHLNRVPISGQVCYVKYHPGKYLLAFHPKSSELNERSTIVISNSGKYEVLVRQIAGFLARRIVTYSQPQDFVQAGQELGFIKFGSRCDIFLPLDASVLVSLNQHVRGGETILAQL